MRRLTRLSVVVGLVLLFLMRATSLLAADPTGASPDDGLGPTCTYQPLGPGASVWLKIPYRFDYRLQFTLDAYGVGGVRFDVYPSATASSPVGTGTYDPNEPTHDLNWEGRLQQDGFYYVLVTNTNAFAVAYRFCVNEKQPFSSPVFVGCVFDVSSPACPPPYAKCAGTDGTFGTWYWDTKYRRWGCSANLK